MKRGRVCQPGDKATPALVKRAGVAMNLRRRVCENYRRWLSSIESAEVYPKRYGIWLESV